MWYTGLYMGSNSELSGRQTDCSPKGFNPLQVLLEGFSLLRGCTNLLFLRHSVLKTTPGATTDAGFLAITSGKLCCSHPHYILSNHPLLIGFQNHRHMLRHIKFPAVYQWAMFSLKPFWSSKSLSSKSGALQLIVQDVALSSLKSSQISHSTEMLYFSPFQCFCCTEYITLWWPIIE